MRGVSGRSRDLLGRTPEAQREAQVKLERFIGVCFARAGAAVLIVSLVESF